MVEVAKKFLDPNSRKSMILNWDLFTRKFPFAEQNARCAQQNARCAQQSSRMVHTAFICMYVCRNLEKYLLLALEGAIKEAWGFKATL